MDTSGSCPDPEVLAAWLDRGASAGEDVQIEAHLAGCDDCRILVANVLETQNAVRDAPIFTPRDEKVVPMTRVARRKTAWRVASVLTAAAMLTLAFVMPPATWRWRGNSIDSKLADLAQAVGSERTVEARLTGGFVYGPLRAAVRSGGSSAALDNWTLLAAAGKIREDATREPSAPHLHALGVAHLVLGQSDEAVRALEDAVAENAQNAQYQSDLAAAYLARARQLDRPDDYGRALGAADRALKTSDTAIEARFNRALALESLFLAERAAEAWQDYLHHDNTSEWASEARQRLQKLQSTSAPRDMARNNSPPPISPVSNEMALDWLVRNGLPRWAEAVGAADAAQATAEQALLTDYATQLTAASGDPFPLALAQVTARPDPVTADSVRHIASALHKLALDDVAAAEPELRAACERAIEPLTLVCDVELGMLDVVHRDRAAATRRLAAALHGSRSRGFVYVEGRAERLDGFQKLFSGDYAGAIPAYRAAFDTSQSGKYGAQAANIAMQIADLYDLSGLRVDGWRWRYIALQAASAVGSPATRYMTRISALMFFGREGQYEASQAFASELQQATGVVSEARRIVALVAFARVALDKKDYRAAKEALATVAQAVSTTKDFRLQRMAPDVSSLMGTLLAAEGDTASAVQSLSEALDAMGPERAAQRAHSLIERARARSLAGYASAAEDDVRAAVATLRNVASQHEPVQLDDVRAAFETVGDLVAARVELQNGSGLFLAEQLREVVDAAPVASRIAGEDDLTRRLTRDDRDAVVFFLFSRRALLVWVSRGGRVHYVERSLDPRALEQAAGVLSVQVARGAREEVLREPLGDLYDQLLRGLPGIETAESILIVPDGPLGMIPFAALFDRSAGKFLFERATVRIAPNIAMGSALAPAPITPARGVLTIADPLISGDDGQPVNPLPAARDEAEAVAALYPASTLLIGDQATKMQVQQHVSNMDVVHYAGHALPASTGGPARLLLSGRAADTGAVLRASELASKLNGTRVVLAACETGTSAADRATGVTSLAAGFLRSGANSVVGTLWKLPDDEASRYFFVAVHRALAAGQPTPVSVINAQRECRANAACRRVPATWIGTVAYGSN